jgi:nicotinamidase/pyrazinamidase
MKSFLKKFFLILFLVIFIAVAYFVYLNKQADSISKGEQIPRYDSVKSALFVVDIQEATTGKVSITDEYIQQSDSLIEKINNIIKHSENKNIPIIYIYTETDSWFIHLLNNTMKKGSIGTQIDSRLLRVSDYILPKEKKDAFSNPSLDIILRKNEISRLYIVGLDAAYCVKNTISAALNRGFEVLVIEDALISETKALKEEMIQYFKNNGVKIIRTFEYYGD